MKRKFWHAGFSPRPFIDGGETNAGGQSVNGGGDLMGGGPNFHRLNHKLKVLLLLLILL